MSKKKLGRDLGSLLSGFDKKARSASEEHKEVVEESSNNAGFVRVSLDDITPNTYQPRKAFSAESLHELSESIKRQGILQPILVREKPQGGFELIAGERRWRASKLAGLDSIPAIVKSAFDEEVSVLALVENIQRDNLNAFEEAAALGRLRDEFKLTQEEIASAVGRSRAAVANLLRLLMLGETAKNLLLEGHIEMGHARALLGVENLNDQEALAIEIKNKSLSVRQAELLVRKFKDKKTKSVKRLEKDADVAKLERSLSDHLGAQTTIKEKAKGAGELIVEYSSLEELEGIIEKIGMDSR